MVFCKTDASARMFQYLYSDDIFHIWWSLLFFVAVERRERYQLLGTLISQLCILFTVRVMRKKIRLYQASCMGSQVNVHCRAFVLLRDIVAKVWRTFCERCRCTISIALVKVQSIAGRYCPALLGTLCPIKDCTTIKLRHISHLHIATVIATVLVVVVDDLQDGRIGCEPYCDKSTILS